jgi:hypothetical protein
VARVKATLIEMRPYGALEAHAAIGTWFSSRYPAAEALERLRTFVAHATNDQTTMLAEVSEADLPDVLGALCLMQEKQGATA